MENLELTIEDRKKIIGAKIIFVQKTQYQITFQLDNGVVITIWADDGYNFPGQLYVELG